MADPDHVTLINRSIEMWNRWREAHPNVKPDLSGVSLPIADLRRADLREANLSGAGLRGADLRRANLHGANLNGAYFREADLTEANLSMANLSGAYLREANLSMAKLCGANLQNCRLFAARLIAANFDGADLTDVRLWETQRAGWSIKGVHCEAVYWDQEGKEKTSYKSGEFEKLFAEMAKVRLLYKDGINPLEIATLPALIQHLEESHPGCGLRLVSIHEDSGGVVVELAIEDAGAHSPEQLLQLKATIEVEAQQKVEYQRKALAEREIRLQLEGALQQSNAIIDKLLLKPTITLNNQGGSMGDTYNVSGQAGAVGSNAHAHDMTFNQVVSQLEKTIDLSELATQLAELRQAISARQDSSPQTALALGKVTEAEIAAKEKNSSKVVESLKAAGQWTLDFAKELGKDLAVEAIKQSMGQP